MRYPFSFDPSLREEEARRGFWECGEETENRGVSGSPSFLLQHSQTQHPRHEHAQV